MDEQRVAGRALDAEIAERVMGRRVSVDRNGEALEFFGDYPNGFYAAPRMYSTQIHAVWKVVEKLMESQLMVSVNCSHESGWWCAICPPSGSHTESAFADTAPLAICLAALDALQPAQSPSSVVQDSDVL